MHYINLSSNFCRRENLFFHFTHYTDKTGWQNARQKEISKNVVQQNKCTIMRGNNCLAQNSSAYQQNSAADKSGYQKVDL